MSGKKLAMVVLVPFLALAAIGYWLTRLEPAAPQPASSPPGAEEARGVPSARSLFGKHGPKTGPAPSTGAEPVPSRAPLAVPAAAPSRTPVTDGLTQALLDARPKPIAPAASATPEPTGSVDKEAVRSAVKAVTPLVRQCFEDAAKRYPGPHKVKLSFTIQGQGLTGYLKDGEVAESTIHDPFLEGCFLEAMADAKFPPPHGGGTVKITYPFSFTPDEDAGP
ncbi:MAG: AgmX/PglI C-terminal domain-containing protein [Myxococcaceae bacterium]